MYCSRCGNYVYDNTQVCPYCGNLTANYSYCNTTVPQVSQPVYYIAVNSQPMQQIPYFGQPVQPVQYLGQPVQQLPFYGQVQPVQPIQYLGQPVRQVPVYSQTQPVQRVQTVRQVQPEQPKKRESNTGNGLRTNVCAIVGFILAFFIAIAGLVCSIIGLSNSKKAVYGYKGSGLSVAGIILSIMNMLCAVALIILWAVGAFNGATV